MSPSLSSSSSSSSKQQHQHPNHSSGGGKAKYLVVFLLMTASLFLIYSTSSSSSSSNSQNAKNLILSGIDEVETTTKKKKSSPPTPNQEQQQQQQQTSSSQEDETKPPPPPPSTVNRNNNISPRTNRHNINSNSMMIITDDSKIEDDNKLTAPDKQSLLIVTHGYDDVDNNNNDNQVNKNTANSYHYYSKVFAFYNESFVPREKAIHDYTFVTASRFCVKESSSASCSRLMVTPKAQLEEISFAAKVMEQIISSSSSSASSTQQQQKDRLTRNEEQIPLSAINTRRMIQGVSSGICTILAKNTNSNNNNNANNEDSSSSSTQSRFHWILYLATESMLVNPAVISEIINNNSPPASLAMTKSQASIKIFIGPEYRIGGAMLVRIPSRLLSAVAKGEEKKNSYHHPFFPFILSLSSSSSSSTLDSIVINGIAPSTQDETVVFSGSDCLLRLINMDSTHHAVVSASSSSPSITEPKAFQECISSLNTNYRSQIISSNSNQVTATTTTMASVEFWIDFEKFSGIFQPFVIHYKYEEGEPKNEAQEARNEMLRDPLFAFSPTRSVASFGYCLEFRSISFDACVVRIRVARNHFFDLIKEDSQNIPEPASFLKLVAAAQKKADDFANLIEKVKNQSASMEPTTTGANVGESNTTQDPLIDELLNGARHHLGSDGKTTKYVRPELVAPDAEIEIDQPNTPPPTTTLGAAAENLPDSAGAAPMTLSPEDARLFADRSTGRNPRLRIAIITFASFNPLANKRTFGEELTLVFHKLGWINKKTYCDRWKYDYILENATELMRDDPRPLAWGKIKAIMKFLPLYDWVMWMDTDSLIMNYNVTIESILRHVWIQERDVIIPERIKSAEIRAKKRADRRREIEDQYGSDEGRKQEALAKWDAAVAKENKQFENIPKEGFDIENMTSATNQLGDIDLVIAKDWNGINTGVFFMRNSDWSMKFLKRVNRGLSQSVCPLPLGWWEQRVMMCLLDEKRSKHWTGKDDRHVYYFDHQRAFNSFGFPTHMNKESALYRKGDFVAHFPNCRAFKQCSFYFKQHWKDQFDANKPYYPDWWLQEYRNGVYAHKYPLTWYPPRYWNHMRSVHKNASSSFSNTASHVALYHGGHVDETDLEDDYDGHYAFDNKGGEILEVHKSVVRKRVLGAGGGDGGGSSSSATSSPPTYAFTRKTKETGQRSSLLDQLEAQKSFTLPPPRKSRIQREREKEAEEAKRRKKLDRNKELLNGVAGGGGGGDDGVIPEHDPDAVDQTIHFQSGSGSASAKNIIKKIQEKEVTTEGGNNDDKKQQSSTNKNNIDNNNNNENQNTEGEI